MRICRCPNAIGVLLVISLQSVRSAFFGAIVTNQIEPSRDVRRVRSAARHSGIVMLIVVCVGLACVAGLQYFREIQSPPLPVVQVDTPGPAAIEPSWHLQLTDIPEQKVFIGFKQAGHVFIDASDLCLQPGFRENVRHEELEREDGERPLAEASDISLPDELTQKIWWIVSSDVQAEDRTFDTPYQWLGERLSYVNYACLFLGQKVNRTALNQFRTHKSEPVVALMGFDTPLDLYLKAHEGWIDVTDDNRARTMRELPWLHSWMNKFGVKGVEQCGYSEDVTPDVALLPIKVKMSSNGQQDAHWLVATGCNVLDHWSLVMTNEDGTVSFVSVTMPQDVDGYRPGKVWTVDIDSDGMPEFLIEAQYYEGSSYVLLRLNKNNEGGYSFTGVAATSYEGL